MRVPPAMRWSAASLLPRESAPFLGDRLAAMRPGQQPLAHALACHQSTSSRSATWLLGRPVQQPPTSHCLDDSALAKIDPHHAGRSIGVSYGSQSPKDLDTDAPRDKNDQ